MYETLKELLLTLFSAPGEPPTAPAGNHSHVRVFRAAPAFLRYQLFMLAILAGVVGIGMAVIAVLVLVNEPVVGLILLFLFLLLWVLGVIGVYYVIRMEYDMRYYIITDRSLRIRKGIWTIVEQTLTFANIQNVSIEQGPVQRMLGISTLLVETAGGGSAVATPQGQTAPNYHRASLEGLADAETLRDLIMDYLKKTQKGSGLGHGDDAHGRRTRGRGFSAAEIAALRGILEELRG